MAHNPLMSNVGYPITSIESEPSAKKTDSNFSGDLDDDSISTHSPFSAPQLQDLMSVPQQMVLLQGSSDLASLVGEINYWQLTGPAYSQTKMRLDSVLVDSASPVRWVG